MQTRAVALILLLCLAGAFMVENADAFNTGGGGWCRCKKWCNKWNEYQRGRCGWTKSYCCRRWGGQHYGQQYGQQYG